MLSKRVFEFKGKKYGIDEDQMIPVMAKIEDHISIVELTSGTPMPGKVCMAYTEVVNAGGGLTTPSEVFKELAELSGEKMLSAIKLMVEILSQIDFPSEVEPAKKPGKRQKTSKSQKQSTAR